MQRIYIGQVTYVDTTLPVCHKSHQDVKKYITYYYLDGYCLPMNYFVITNNIEI
jgi:hypothetical protein